jgi:anti-sigma B factor antagonist
LALRKLGTVRRPNNGNQEASERRGAAVRSESGGHIDPTSQDTAVESFGLAAIDDGSTRVLRASGEIDILSAPALRDVLLTALDAVPSVVLDLSEVSFLGSSGLAVLVEAREQAQRDGRQLRLVRPSRIVARALEATGLLELFEVSDDLASVNGDHRTTK